MTIVEAVEILNESLTEEFRNAVSAKNVRLIRIMMKDSLLIDKTFHLFREMASAAKKVDGLYDKHDGKPFKPESEWDIDYMNRQMVEVILNFSHERIEHLKKIIEKLYSKNSPKASDEDASKQSASTPSKLEKNVTETVKIRVLLKQLLRDLWELIKSLGSRSFATIRGKWQTLCRNFVSNAKRTSIGKRFAKIFSKTPNSTEEAKEQINAAKTEVDNLNEAAAIVKAAMILSEEYQTNKSCAFQENHPESNTPYVHRVDYNFYDPNLMDLKKLPSDEEQDSVTEPS